MSNENKSEKIARFLDDTPCNEESAFQIHEEIAQVIANEIVNEPPDNIALIGGWGTGKSTVVERIKQLLKNKSCSSIAKDSSREKTFIYFVFDAWAHSGDSLRRSFLDTLLEKINSEESLPEGTLKKKKDEIYGRVASSTATEKAKFAPLVACGIMAVVSYTLCEIVLRGLLPVAHHFAVLSGFLEATSHTGFSGWINAISLLFAIVIFLIILSAYRFGSEGRERAKARKDQNEKGVDKSSKTRSSFIYFLDALCSAVASIFSKKADTTTTVVRQDYSPALDSIEFEKQFQSILNLTEKTVVIVFDNLDRLDKQALREAWDTLQIFAGYSCIADTTNEKIKRPWILLPISLEVFQTVENFTPQAETLSISKTFIRSFKIPTPIVTDWKKYFLNLAREAFPAANEDELSRVYSIASHSLMRIESRTPRNAKRFINSMVSQSLIFPRISLASIAAYCYAEDCYSIHVTCTQEASSDYQGIQTFSDYIQKLISGILPESQYLGFPSSRFGELDNDLAMMAYGQFSPEKASEVYMAVQLNKLFEETDQINLEQLIKNNSGAWEFITKEFEDMLNPKPDRTPKWVFSALEALYSLDEEIQETDFSEISKLAQTLIKGIVSLNGQGSKDCGSAIASFLDCCSQNDIQSLIETIIDELKTHVEKANSALMQDSETNKHPSLGALREYLDKCIPILEKAYQINYAIQNHLTEVLRSVEFDKTYEMFLDYALDLSNHPDWIASRPPQTLGEFSQSIDMLITLTGTAIFQSPIISTLNDVNLLDEFDLNSDQAEELVALYSDPTTLTGGLAALDVNLWLLLNVCDFQAESVKNLFHAFESSLQELSEYVRDDAVYKQAACLSLVLMHYSGNNYSELEFDFIESLCNTNVAEFLKEHNVDLIPYVFTILCSKDNALKKACNILLEILWDLDDYAKREEEDLYKLIQIKNKTTERIKHGFHIAENDRVNALINKGFNIYWISVYYGALQGLKEHGRDERKLKTWLIEGFQELSEKSWIIAVHFHQFQALIDVLSDTTQNTPLPNLDQALGEEITKQHTDDFMKRIISIIDVYKCNLSYLAEQITHYIIHDSKLISSFVQNNGELLSRCKWLHSLTPEQRYYAAEAIIKTKHAYECEWLYEELTREDNPKELFKGFLRKTRTLIAEQMKLESMKKNKGAKKACSNLLKLLK